MADLANAKSAISIFDEAIWAARRFARAGHGFAVTEINQRSICDMDTAYLSALSALAGSIVGGFSSGLANWLNQRAQARAGMLAHEMTRREDLYRDFILAASKAYGQAIVSSDPEISD